MFEVDKIFVVVSDASVLFCSRVPLQPLSFSLTSAAGSEGEMSVPVASRRTASKRRCCCCCCARGASERRECRRSLLLSSSTRDDEDGVAKDRPRAGHASEAAAAPRSRATALRRHAGPLRRIAKKGAAESGRRGREKEKQKKKKKSERNSLPARSLAAFD